MEKATLKGGLRLPTQGQENQAPQNKSFSGSLCK